MSYGTMGTVSYFILPEQSIRTEEFPQLKTFHHNSFNRQKKHLGIHSRGRDNPLSWAQQQV